jgi:GNAT superfamily N-acetyltransferase
MGVGVLGAGDVGHRVVVRHRTPLGPTDVLGELTALDPDWLVVRTEAGQLRRIARTDVIAGKPVGPRPPRFSEIIALERVADRAWPAPVVQRLGAWLLRYAEGWTNRANSALPLGTADRPLDDAVQECRRFYTDRGLPPKIAVPLPVRRDVSRHLEATGWVAQPRVLVQTAPLDALLHAEHDHSIELVDRPSPELLALVAARKQSPPAAAEHVLMGGSGTGAPAVRFAQARDGQGAVVAGARGAVVDDWLHIGLVEVAAPARRRGLARAITAALATWGVSHRATRALLQVEEHNGPAVRLYQSLGFATHHTYVTYRFSPQPDAGRR